MSDPTEPVNYPMAPATRTYLDALRSLGLLDGDAGARVIPGEVDDVIRGLHHVLAGGSVTISIQSPGSPSVVDELNEGFLRALDETNKLEVEIPGIKVCY
jgi:hypothetical protein